MALKKNNNGDWIADYRDSKDKRIRINLGKSKRVAEEQYTRLKAQVREEKIFGGSTPEKLLLQEFITEYLEWYSTTKSKNSLESVTNTLNIFGTYFKDRYLHEIKAKNIEMWRAELSKSLKTSTTNLRLTHVRALFNRAVEWEYLTQNPINKVKPLKVDKPSFRLLTEAEIAIILEESKGFRDHELFYALNIGLYAGLRFGEILNLRWEDLDFRVGVIRVESRAGAQTKTRQSRVVPMSQHLKDILATKPRPIHGGPVIGLSRSSTKKRMLMLQTRTNQRGVDHWTLHDTRHYFASALVMAGADLVAVSKLLGHSNIAMTMRYSHTSPSHLKETVNLLNGHFLDNLKTENNS